jgi:hypothetical protein
VELRAAKATKSRRVEQTLMSITCVSACCSHATAPRRCAPWRRVPTGCALALVVAVMLIAVGEAARGFDPVQYASSDMSVASSLIRASYAAPVELPPVVVAVPVDPQSPKPFDNPFGAALAGQPITPSNTPAALASQGNSVLTSAQPGEGLVDDGVGIFDGFTVERSREMPDDRTMNRRRRLRTIRKFNQEFASRGPTASISPIVRMPCRSVSPTWKARLTRIDGITTAP